MRILLITIVLLFSLQVYSQKLAITFYDHSWFLTTRDFAQFYRVGFIDTVTYKYYGEVKDFYISGVLQMNGLFENNIKNGNFYFYYPTGELATKGSYKDNYRYGIWTNYYHNGNVKDKIVFNKGFLSAIESYDLKGYPKMINGTGIWETKYFNDFYKDSITVLGQYKDTIKEGSWYYYKKRMSEGKFQDTKHFCTENFDNGKFTGGNYYLEDGKVDTLSRQFMRIFPETIKFENIEKWEKTIYVSRQTYPYLKFLPTSTDSTLFPVDTPAEFPGGLDSLTKVFSENIKLSKSYIASQQQRSSVFLIEINEKGTLILKEDPNPRTLDLFPDNKAFYLQALKSIKLLADWKPAQRDSKNVKNQFMLIVNMDKGEITILLENLNMTKYKIGKP